MKIIIINNDKNAIIINLTQQAFTEYLTQAL